MVCRGLNTTECFLFTIGFIVIPWKFVAFTAVIQTAKFASRANITSTSEGQLSDQKLNFLPRIVPRQRNSIV